jgi:hypothetical protein
MRQVHHIVPLSTTPILPEKKVCGYLTACVDVDLVLLHCFRNDDLPPAPAAPGGGRLGGRGARARVPGLAGGIQTRFGRVVYLLQR